MEKKTAARYLFLAHPRLLRGAVLPFAALTVLLFVAHIWNKSRSFLDITSDHTWLSLDPLLDGPVPKEIPRVLHQTYTSLALIPPKVSANLQRFAPGFSRAFYDDTAIELFLKQHFHPSVGAHFSSLRIGAHKADLFRYCVMYTLGGVYMDIKTELVRTLEGLFPPSRVTTVLSRKWGEIYQGILAAPPRQPIFLALIDAILKSGADPPYDLFLQDFMDFVIVDLSGGYPKEGLNDGLLHKYYFFTETCTTQANNCEDGLDRYGFCCAIQLNGTRVIKTRYSDFPWPSKPTK